MMRMLRNTLKSLIIIAFLYALFVVVARLSFPLPDIADRPLSESISATNLTSLGRAKSIAAETKPGLSGILALTGGNDALASRLNAIDQAQESIDAQYYIWKDDVSGILLLNALDEASRRGVRVRLLLDDNGVPGLDPFLATLNAQENFEIRLFNPSTVRAPKALGYFFDPLRMNRRMHNKSLTVDGAMTIIGGRNIGDEYFEVGDAFYKDMDVLALGEIAPQVASTFDEYWNSRSVYEVETIISGHGNRASFEARVLAVMAAEETQIVLEGLQKSVIQFANVDDITEWTTVQLVADDPIKGEGNGKKDDLMITRLGDILGDIESRIDLASAYFVPGVRGTAYFSELARQGIDVNILTNALNTTDVLMVHAGYSKYRRELLEAGVDLFELKLRGGVSQGSEYQLKSLGLSGASLHAKTFAIDDNRIFIGSFNFDPRSAILNCEMGFLIDSPKLAKQLSTTFDTALRTVSYQPKLTPNSKMIWLEQNSSGEPTVYQQEPEANWLTQFSLTIIGLLPIEWML